MRISGITSWQTWATKAKWGGWWQVNWFHRILGFLIPLQNPRNKIIDKPGHSVWGSYLNPILEKSLLSSATNMWSQKVWLKSPINSALCASHIREFAIWTPCSWHLLSGHYTIVFHLKQKAGPLALQPNTNPNLEFYNQVKGEASCWHWKCRNLDE